MRGNPATRTEIPDNTHDHRNFHSNNKRNVGFIKCTISTEQLTIQLWQQAL